VRFEPGGLFDGPDNITVSPHGGVFLAEDGDGDQYVIYVDKRNQAFAFAKNRIQFNGGFQEFTGPTFSPDGRFLFVNTQQPGITYAITGPWSGGRANGHR
jgi:secreted PhoX family phosphatase